MKQNTVIFDIDEVVAMTWTEFSRVFERLSGKVVPYEDFHTIYFYDIYGVHFCNQTMMDEKVLENCLPVEGAVECFNEIRKAGNRIVLITARGWHNDAMRVTEQWFNHFGLEYDELHVVPGHEGKTLAFDRVAKDSRIIAFVDDQPRYIEQGAAHNDVENVFIFDRPWNRQVEGNRIFSLKEFSEAVKKIV